MFCEQCGAKNEAQIKFCTSCGAKMQVMGNTNNINTGNNNPISPESNSPVIAAQSQVAKDYFGKTGKSAKKEGGLKKLITGIVLVAAVGALLYGGINIFKGSNSAKTNRDRSKFPIVYVKSSQLMVRGNGKDSSFVATSGGGDYNGNVLLTADGKTMFFADDASSDGYRLYYRKVDQETPKGKDADSKGIRIATGVTSFNIQKDGKFVVYKKDDRLYYSNLKEEKSIASDVIYFVLSSDEKKVIYSKSDGSIYTCVLGKKFEPEKVDSDISSIVSPINECDNLYYIKDSTLYQKKDGKEKERLARDIESARMVGSQVYVVKKDEFAAESGYSLYKVVNGELTKITDGLANNYLLSANFNYSEYDVGGGAAAFIKTPQNSDGTESGETTQELYIIQGDNPPFKAMDIDITSIGQYKFSGDGKYFYIVEELNKSGNEGELFRYTVGTDSLKDRTRICDIAGDFTVYDTDVVITSNKNGKTTLGLYTGGKYTEISDEAGFYYRYINGALYYLDDYSSNKNIGNLMKYKNGKPQKIDIDVCNMDVRNDDYVVYIKDYSTRRNYGDLYYKKGRRKPVKVDTDVSYIVTIY